MRVQVECHQRSNHTKYFLVRVADGKEFIIEATDIWKYKTSILALDMLEKAGYPRRSIKFVVQKQYVVKD